MQGAKFNDYENKGGKSNYALRTGDGVKKGPILYSTVTFVILFFTKV